MKRITYGAPRLVDWVAQIKAGAATVRVHFTGGALTAYGITPAEYTTDNPFIQKVIEQSSYFKEGRITLLRRTEIANTAMPTKPVKTKSKQPSTPVERVAEEAPVTTGKDSDAQAPRQTTEEAADVDEANVTTDNFTIVEVTCLQDAQAYLQENYNVSSYKVRSYDAAQRAAAEHGVRFIGAKFGTADGTESSENETTEEEE